jgi:phosphate/sulfate permease
MDAAFVGLVIIVLVALAFDYTNGFHDAANAIAVAVSTKALTPRVALALAAVMNLVGALISTSVAKTVGAGIIDPPEGDDGLVIVFAALIGAITWNMITWWYGLPSSSSHALIGGLVGAALAAAHSVQWMGVLDKVIIPMILSPLVGFGLGYLFMLAILWSFRGANVSKANRGFRFAQIFSSSTMALGHGMQDAQKTMGIITLALIANGSLGADADPPFWVIASAATAIALGTYSGGWRIIRTTGSRIIKMDAAQGFSAQSSGAAVILASTHFGFPLSTTHVINGGVMGAGAGKRISAVRWGVAGNIFMAWLLTLPAAAAIGAGVYGFTYIFGSGALGPVLVTLMALGLIATIFIRRAQQGSPVPAA